MKYRELEKELQQLSKEAASQKLRELFSNNILNISKMKRIKVAFLVYSSSEWKCEYIYKKMIESNCFDPDIIVCGYNHGTRESIARTYSDACTYFESKEVYNVICAGCEKSEDTTIAIDAYQIVFYLIPYRYALLPTYLNMEECEISQMIVYVPYAFMLVGLINKTRYYSAPVMSMSWKFYISNLAEYKAQRENHPYGGENCVFSGCPAYDKYFINEDTETDSLWKNKNSAKKKIIWAPHWSLANGSNGTFYENYQWFYEYAKRHQEISWIVKPHPRMEIGTIQYGLFKNSREYIKYLSLWEELPNARVIEFGPSYDIFTSSDAMILDSISYVAEYQFTGKPLLFLLSKKERLMNELGDALMKTVYRARGDSFLEIEDFIMKVMDCDPMKERRNAFFNENLNYERMNGKLASDYIFDSIKESIWGESIN